MGDGGHESLLLRIFFANYLSPITIFVINLYKPLIDKEIVWVTDTSKWGFIPHVSLTILALSLTILRKQWSKKASLNLEACFMNRWSRLHWLLKQASFANEVSFISSWFEAQIKFTWASIKVYLSLTSNSNEAQDKPILPLLGAFTQISP